MTAEPRACPSCATPLAEGTHFCPNCGTPTPTEPGVPQRTMPTGTIEVNRVRRALADHYRIEHVLGEGGMATVYMAEDLKHHRKVAVKVMRPDLAETLGAERFLREIEIAAKLSHPHILPVHDSGAVDGVFYYVMPLVEGESLPSRLSRERQLPVGEALRLTREVAEALAYAHKRGIVHRDIKPANILISEGHALVADFGIARATGDGAKALTQTGLAIGTPQYMSPEQASGEHNIDGRSDIYALGCVAYEMLAGEPPFTGPTAQAIVARALTEPARPITKTRMAVSPLIDGAIQKALAKAPADRYATGTEFAAALTNAEDQARTGSGEAPAAVRPAAAKRSPLLLVAAAVLVIIAGVAGWKMFGGPAAVPVSSMAVLPFDNQGPQEDAYFADGIVEELRDRLTALKKFTVIASASADQYKETNKTPVEIARELRVGQVLTGNVRWATDASGAKKFRVTAELVDAAGKVTWRGSFDGDASDPFAIQGQIATRVATALGTVLGEAEEQNLASRPTQNAEAYNLFLKGRAITEGSAQGARERVALFERAVVLDSNFIAGWGFLTSALTDLYGSGTRDPATARRAKEALDRTMALAPDSAAAHMVAANYYSIVARDQAAARRAVERAHQLDPDFPWALRTMARYDLDAGRFEQMQQKLARARELDPLNKANLSNLIRAQLYTGQHQAALATAKELEALEVTSFDHMQWVAGAYLANDDLAGARRAVASLAKNVPVTDLVSYFAGYHEMAFVLTEEQRQLLFRMTPASFDNDRAWWGQALATAAWQQGDKARAKAYADSSLAIAQQQIAAAPDDAQLRLLNAVSLAYAGRTADAVREAETGIADTVGLNIDNTNYALQQYARALLAAGQVDRGLDAVEALSQRQYLMSPGWLKNDPMFRDVRSHPKYQRLVSGMRAARD